LHSQWYQCYARLAYMPKNTLVCPTSSHISASNQTTCYSILYPSSICSHLHPCVQLLGTSAHLWSLELNLGCAPGPLDWSSLGSLTHLRRLAVQSSTKLEEGFWAQLSSVQVSQYEGHELASKEGFTGIMAQEISEAHAERDGACRTLALYTCRQVLPPDTIGCTFCPAVHKSFHPSAPLVTPTGPPRAGPDGTKGQLRTHRSHHTAPGG
jgi:hypothetical protein